MKISDADYVSIWGLRQQCDVQGGKSQKGRREQETGVEWKFLFLTYSFKWCHHLLWAYYVLDTMQHTKDTQGNRPHPALPKLSLYDGDSRTTKNEYRS